MSVGSYQIGVNRIVSDVSRIRYNLAKDYWQYSFQGFFKSSHKSHFLTSTDTCCVFRLHIVSLHYRLLMCVSASHVRSDGPAGGR